MRLVSDYGGQPAGKVVRDEYPPSDFDKRVDAVRMLIVKSDRRYTSDSSRRAQEELPQDVYDSLAYYDRWLTAFRRNMVELGYLTDAEIDERIAALKSQAQK